MNLTELRHLLDRKGIRLTRSLGQCFMHDGNQLRRIVDAAGLAPTDKVLEIGPGLGPLTELILDRAQHVLAIEKDQRLADLLRERFHDRANLDLRHGDGLELVKNPNRDWTGWKLVANLPYSVASPILVELALGPHPPSLLVATLQLEVARRLFARPGVKEYGLLTLLVTLQYEPLELFKIPATCFFPTPDVDSACVVLKLVPDRLPEAHLRKRFVSIAKHSFGQRRKMMFKLLRQLWPEEKLAAAFEQLHLSIQTRAETVSLEQFVALTRLLSERSPPACM